MIRCIAALLMGGAVLCAASPAPTLPPVEAFFAEPEFRSPRLSPDGRTLAMTGTRKFKDFLATIDLATMKPTASASFTDGTLVDFWWKGNDWVIFVIENQAGFVSFRSFDLTKRKVVNLANFNRRGARLVAALPDDPYHVLAETPTADGVELRKLDVRTGKSVIVQPDPGFVQRWVVNRAGVALAALKAVNEKWSVLLRPDAATPWTETPQGTMSSPALSPNAISADGRELLAYEKPTDRPSRLVAIDLATGARRTLRADETEDAGGLGYWNPGDVSPRGVEFGPWSEQASFFSAGDAELVAQLGSALDGARAVIVSQSEDGNRMVVAALSPAGRQDYWLFDRTAGSLLPLGSTRPVLDGRRLGESRPFTFAARDGQTLHGRIWLPHDRSGPAPAALLVTDFDPEASQQAWLSFDLELLRTRGYAILRVKHRGSPGFGPRFSALGTDQLHAAIADDLADAAKHAQAEGWVASGKVGLYGRGVMGVAAVHSFARNPGTFAVWLNDSTRLSRDALWERELIFGLYPTQVDGPAREVLKAARSYRASLDPLKAAAAITVPSFHHCGSREFLNLDTDSLLRRLREAGTPHVFFEEKADETSTTTEARRERRLRDQTALYQALLAFLSQHLPAG